MMSCRKFLPLSFYLFLLSAIISGMLFLCGRSPSEPNRSECGSIQIRALVRESLRKSTAAATTSFENLELEIYGNGNDTLRFSSKISGNLMVVNDTFSGIPAGVNHEVKIYTTDNNGIKVHIDSLDKRIVKIEKNAVTVINATLIPAAGSIYMQLANVSTDIDSVSLSFVSIQGTWEKRLKRNLKMNLSLDNIPDGTEGTVYFTAINSAGDTLCYASKKITFNARESSELDFEFDFLPGSLAMDIAVRRTGVTLITMNMAEQINSEENGKLIITEIMYNAADSSKYIKIYNPSETAITFETLIVEIDKSRKKIDSVVVEAQRFYVLGKKEDSLAGKSIQLALAKAGNLITLRDRDSTIIDRVIFIGTNNSLEWPVAAISRAIYLNSDSYDVSKNNFGRNWYTVTDQDSESDSLQNTPN